MRTLFSIATAAWLVFAQTALASTGVQVKVKGMSCGSCVEKVSEQLKALKGVEKDSVTVELAQQTATLKVAQADPATLKAIEAAVKKAGYKVEKIDVPEAAAVN